jgi:hypothetical protein
MHPFRLGIIANRTDNGVVSAVRVVSSLQLDIFSYYSKAKPSQYKRITALCNCSAAVEAEAEEIVALAERVAKGLTLRMKQLKRAQQASVIQ